jgi:predicted TIM-barrel fold metal-dependent hydrolase
MALSVIDPHVHFWSMAPGANPWLERQAPNFLGDYSDLARPALPRTFREHSGDIEILGVVHIDAGARDPLAETAWLQSLAESDGWPDAIVAFADLSRPDIESQLEAQTRYPNIRGIRQILNVHPDPIYDYVGRNYLDEEAWLRGYRILRRFGLSFDLQLYPHQMKRAAEVLAANPDTPVVLNHAGMFADRGTPQGWRTWRDGIHALAALPHVHVKISGLGMMNHKWSVESIRPYVLESIDAFGVDRSMFASNFPVDSLYSDYATLWHAFEETISGCSAEERAKLFRTNAQSFYRIEL